ncbi:LOW QUALITY PROTEIN: uncharacterized protein LOC135480207 [Liolophura sinensis]|uniref:LOW QUALITY PROTEIN: uncharacterized protein LOC135480207 n=1 Tax=Liolophura sinensis TaxID=3198878 RepID=UPI003158D2E3
MSCQWGGSDYLSALMSGDKRSHTALERLVDDLHSDKDQAVNTFLSHSGSEDFLWGLVKLVANGNSRVAGNAAYIIGSLAESELGCFRVLSLARARNEEGKQMLNNLTRMLAFNDAESVMNAAGTLGTLAESHEGRDWILSESCLDEMIDRIASLLHNPNLWTASNAALVLARLSISEGGCSRVLNHENWQAVLTKLTQSLGVDEAGRGMNAAFAVGRLCDTSVGRMRLLALPESEKMISSLAKMLCSQDTGVSKNACFALSCLATSMEGHSRLLANCYVDHVLQQLTERLTAEDSETGWFAAMTLRTLACQPKGCLKLRTCPNVISALKAIENNREVNSDLREEVLVTLEILKKLEKPRAPRLQVKGSNVVVAEWDEVQTKSGLEVFYELFEGSSSVYTGTETCCSFEELKPLTEYRYKLRAYTEGDVSPFSDSVTVTTEETVPGAPSNPRILGCTATQLKVAWDPPEQANGILKGYYVYNGQTLVEHTHEMMSIITGLQAATSYEIEICTATSKGKGPRACVVGQTAETGAHAPGKPDVSVMGRNEINVSWKPPEVPLGRITRYDLTMNGKLIYSGTDLSYGARRLVPDTEYAFVVTALTNEGRFESKPAKRRTSRDEYDVNRAPLYQPPVRKEEEPTKAPTTDPVRKRKSLTGTTETKLPTRTLSASSKHSATAYKLCRTWTKIDLNTTRQFVKKESRTSPTNSGVKDAHQKKEKEWHIDDSYPLVTVSKGTKSLVGMESVRRERTTLQNGSKRRNSDCFPRAPVQRDRARGHSKDLPAWSKPVFPLNLGSMSQASTSDTNGKLPNSFTHTDSFLGLTTPVGLRREKSNVLSLARQGERRYGITLRPLNRGNKFLNKDPQETPVLMETPTWAPPMDLITQKAQPLHNKFVPMQFRTQPSNLSMGQIERMNTQVLESKGLGGMNLKRIQSLSRSHTHGDLRSTDHSSSSLIHNLKNRDHKDPLTSVTLHDLNRVQSHSPPGHQKHDATWPVNAT